MGTNRSNLHKPDLARILTLMSYFYHISTGSYFIARFEDRLVWLSVLECGFTHCTIVVKGLELHETSCHTTEAQMIDTVFQQAFEEGRNGLCNPYPTHVLTPR